MAKGPEAFRTISEAADELDVPQHVLRFWETKFNFIRPMKRAGGRRFYRPSDIAVLKGVRRLLHDEGYTIKGVQRLHREQGVRRLIAAGAGQGAGQGVGQVAEADMPLSPSVAETGLAQGAPLTEAARGRLTEILHELEDAKRRLDGILRT